MEKHILPIYLIDHNIMRLKNENNFDLVVYTLYIIKIESSFMYIFDYVEWNDIFMSNYHLSVVTFFSVFIQFLSLIFVKASSANYLIIF